MKKFVSLLIVLTLGLVIVSCGSGAIPDDTSCTDILNAVISGQQDVPDSENLFSPDKEELDEYTFSIIIDGMYQQSEEFALVDDYAMYLCDGNHTYEIDILRAKNSADAQTLKSALDRRIKLLSGGDKAIYDPDFDKMMSSAKVYCEGNFAVLLITKDNSAAEKSIDGFKK